MGRRSISSGTIPSTVDEGLWAGLPLGLDKISDYQVFFTDFQDQFDEDDMILTNSTSGTGDLVADMPGGQYQITATTDNQGIVSLQRSGAETAAEGLAVPAAGRNIVFESRVQLSVLTSIDWFVGMGETGTAFIGTDGLLDGTANADNHAGFHHIVADAGLVDLSVCGTAIANVQTITGTGAMAAVLAKDTWYRFGFKIEGVDYITFYLDGVQVSARSNITTDLADGLVPTYGLIAAGSASIMAIDYILVASTRLAADVIA